jgi:tetratricopeptide (TPR) repeat protein
MTPLAAVVWRAEEQPGEAVKTFEAGNTQLRRAISDLTPTCFRGRHPADKTCRWQTFCPVAVWSGIMKAMIPRGLLFGVSVLLAISHAHANPIEDCNQSADAERQIEACTEFLQQDAHGSNAALAYGLRGEAYRDKGDLDHAIADFSQAIKIDRAWPLNDPGSFRVYVNRGIAYRDKGDLDGAIADFSKAIEFEPEFADAFVNRCVVYADKGQYDLALADCTKAIAINPKDAVAYNDRGVAYEKKGDIDGALADYTKAIELDPSYRDAYANRAVLYDHKGDREHAVGDYRQALAKNPSREDRLDLEAALERLNSGP